MVNTVLISEEHELYINNYKKQKRLILCTQIIIFVLFFLIWELLASLNVIDPFIFSKPTRIFNTIIKMTFDGTIFIHLFTTISEIILSFLVSSIIGILISIYLWSNSFSEKVLKPYLVVLNSIPKTALAPIIIVFFGNNTKSIIVTAIMTSVIVTIINILTGFLEVDKDLIVLLKSFGATKKQILFKIVLPSSFASITSALKINIGLSFVGVIVGEFLVSQAGLGYLIIYGSQIFRMDLVMTSIIILGLLSAIMYKIISYCESKILNYFI